MQEVEGVMSGTLDYSKLRGDTGPLVYPAGFVYVYSALHWITNDGTNIRLAQWIFLGLYLLLTGVVAVVLHKSRAMPQWAIFLICFSKVGLFFPHNK